MKKIETFILLFAFSIIFPLVSLGQSKVVYLPDNINIEDNAVKTEVVRNLSEVDIYQAYPIYVIDNFIYLSEFGKHKVFKLSLQGKVIARFGREGQGPGEVLAVYGIGSFKENIAIIGKYKVIICNKDLKFIREMRIKERFQDIIVANNNRIYFYNNPSYLNYYFTVYTHDFKFLKRFGIKDPNKNEKKNYENYKISWDIIRKTLYVPEENGIWVSFRNRYDLRYYKDEKVVVDIKSEKQSFASKEDEFGGQKIKRYKDYSILIAKHENYLFYFYVKGDNILCDIFDLDENYLLYRRLKFPFLYKQLVHSNGSVFYGLKYDSDKENVLLDKIKIKPKRR